MTPEEVLDIKLPDNDAGAATVRDYLKVLLLKVWQEDEEFDGKRPFGNSCWWTDITDPIIDAGYYGDPLEMVEKAITAL